MPLKDREAHKAYCKAQYLAKREERLAGHRTARAADPEKYRARDKARWAAYSPTKRWLKNLKAFYGLTREDYDSMLIAQAGKCGLCWLPLGPKDGVVDHDHVTGEVRSLLHIKCNGLLAGVEDGQFLAQATAYLEAHRG